MAFSNKGASGGLADLVSDTTPQLGGNLDAQGYYIDLTEQSAPASPSANVGRLYVADNATVTSLYFKDSAGTATNLITTSGANTALSNLASVAINTTLVSDTNVTDSLGSASVRWKDLFLGGDITDYDAVNDGNPEIKLGSADAEELHIQSVYDTGAQTLDYVLFQTDVASATADKGLYRFNVDGTAILDIDDGGINFAASKGISIAGADIITDSAGTATLSNIDALDAITEATIEAAIDTLSNLTTATALPWTGMKPGVDGEIPTFDSSGNPAFAAVGTAGQVFTSNGAGAAPTMQDAAASSTFWTDDGETTAYASATTFTISGQDETAKFFAGRGLKLTQAGVNSGNPYYGSVFSSTFSTNTTVTVIALFDIANEALTVALCNERIPSIIYSDLITSVADTTNPIGRVYTKEAGTALGCQWRLNTAPTGSASDCDIHIGGTSDYTTAANPTIAAAGTSSGFTRGDKTAFLADVAIEFFTDTVGSTIKGGAPTIQFFYIPKAWENLT